MGVPFWIVVGVLASLLAAGVAFLVWRAAPRYERDRLRRRFGPEYERAVEETGSGKAARRELRRRLRRAARLDLRELEPEERARFAAIWSDLREAFSDDPSRSVLEAGRLVKEVMQTEGYPIESSEQLAADLSVRYPKVVQHYRQGRALARRAATGRASTDELRRALIHYNVLFSELLRAPEAERRERAGAQPVLGS
jgi:hypothetical protein